MFHKFVDLCFCFCGLNVNVTMEGGNGGGVPLLFPMFSSSPV